MTTPLFAFLLAGGLWTAPSPCAGAGVCVCVPPGDPHGDRDDGVDAVFVGRVLSVEEEPIEREGWRSVLQRATLRVSRSWKGPETDTIVVETRVTSVDSPSSCDMPFRVGRRYLVFARRAPEGGALTTGLCMGTNRLENASTALQHLGPARGERPGTSPP